jgi:membrane fusion protein, adhesin transport system
VGAVAPTDGEPLIVAVQFARTTQSLALNSARGAWIAIGIAALVLMVWSSWLLAGSVVVYQVSQRARLESDRAPRDLSTLDPGRVVATRLVLGQRVRTGEVLVELDRQPQRLRLDDARRRLSAFPSKLASLRREVAALSAAGTSDSSATGSATLAGQARLREADTNARFAAEFARRRMADSEAGGTPRVEAMRAQADAQRAVASRDAIEQEVHRLTFDATSRGGQNAARIEELARQSLELESQRSATLDEITGLRLEIDRRLIRSPVSGIVAAVQPIHPGAVVSAGARLATIVPPGALSILADFEPAGALGRIRPGQKATLRLTGYPWAQYGDVSAVVERVAGEQRDGRLQVELRATHSSLHGVTLAHGLAGTLEVAVEQVSPARLLLRTLGRSLW